MNISQCQWFCFRDGVIVFFFWEINVKIFLGLEILVVRKWGLSQEGRVGRYLWGFVFLQLRVQQVFLRRVGVCFFLFLFLCCFQEIILVGVGDLEEVIIIVLFFGEVLFIGEGFLLFSLVVLGCLCYGQGATQGGGELEYFSIFVCILFFIVFEFFWVFAFIGFFGIGGGVGSFQSLLRKVDAFLK